MYRGSTTGENPPSIGVGGGEIDSCSKSATNV
jgi:hypothetical protein